ncbi:DNA cytosine methyltransferase [Streptomyces cyaneofuscatus]|uniref:DNA cytosine methyltransferase n=1 Tax=Streptomyces cyaneofuscatus TaxID=66883 RepID=UPI00369C88FC
MQGLFPSPEDRNHTTRTADSCPPSATTCCIEICAGAGGQALGLERAGFELTALVELGPDAAQTLRLNRLAGTSLRPMSEASRREISP